MPESIVSPASAAPRSEGVGSSSIAGPLAGPAATAPAVVAPVVGPADLSPDFIREAWREIISFLETTWAAVARPGAFAQSWVRGESTAMNPLAYFGICLSLAAAMDTLERHLTGVPDRQSAWWYELLGQNLSVAAVALYGLWLQWDLKRHGFSLSRRAAVGLTLFTFGSMDFAINVLSELAQVGWWAAAGRLMPHAAITGTGFAGLAAEWIWLTRMIHGATRVSSPSRSIWQLADRILGVRWFARWTAAAIAIILGLALYSSWRGVRSDEAWEASARRALTKPAAVKAWDKHAQEPEKPIDDANPYAAAGQRTGRFFRRLFQKNK